MVVRLLTTDSLAVWLDCFRAWPEGFTFFFRVRRRNGALRIPDLDVTIDDGEVVWPGLVLSVDFGAAGRAETREGDWPPQGPPEDPAAPYFTHVGTGASPDRNDSEYLLTPLPEGTVRWGFAWPEAGIEGVERAMDIAPLRAAALESHPLW